MTERLQAVSAASAAVVWASGLGGRWLRSEDGGQTWASGVLNGAADLELRDIHALSSDAAYVLAAGPGERSRIYRTDDGGATWTEQFRNIDPDAFYDCFAFWNASSGFAFSDSVDGRFLFLFTSDGGEEWKLRDTLPPALGPEGGLAASGTCVLAHGATTAWIATAAGQAPRVLHTTDRGATWSASRVPVLGGTPTSGLATLAFWDESHGLAAGGDITEPDLSADVVARTDDGGRSWRSAARPPFPGPVYGSAVVPGAQGLAVVIVGPGGAALSTDGGAHWSLLTSIEHWAVTFATEQLGFMVGPEGRVTSVRFEP